VDQSTEAKVIPVDENYGVKLAVKAKTFQEPAIKVVESSKSIWDLFFK
jgi:hypothetical protein